MLEKTDTRRAEGNGAPGQESVTVNRNNTTDTANNQGKVNVDTILRAVTAYHEKGIQTFPLNRDKFPVVKGWNDHDFTPEQHRVDGFHGLGTCPGRWPVDVMIFDIDGPQGRESWAQCLKQYGPLPDTYTVTTGRKDGGTHLYYKMPDGLYVKSTASKFAEKVDIRGTRGQAVLPPTVHRSGKIYQWNYAGNPCEIPDPENIPLLPEDRKSVV